MQGEVAAAAFSTLELLVLVFFIAMPVLLIVSYFVFSSRFKSSKLDMRAAEREIMSELARLEKQTSEADDENTFGPPGRG